MDELTSSLEIPLKRRNSASPNMLPPAKKTAIKSTKQSDHRNNKTAHIKKPNKDNETTRLLIFLSHSSKYKDPIGKLRENFRQLKIDAFIAHQDINPGKEWQIELINNLKKMDVLLAFITDDFHASSWTNQEIGYALGRGIKIGKLKFDGDPKGFIGSEQALSCSWNDPILFEKILRYLFKNKLLPEKKYSDLYTKYKKYIGLFGEEYIKVEAFKENTSGKQKSFIQSKMPSENCATLFVNNYHNDYGYHTTCELYKGREHLSDINLGHDRLKKNEYLNKLLPAKLFLLNDRFFSRVSPLEDLNENDQQALKLIFNHSDDKLDLIENHPGAKELIEKSLFRDENDTKITIPKETTKLQYISFYHALALLYGYPERYFYNLLKGKTQSIENIRSAVVLHDPHNHSQKDSEPTYDYDVANLTREEQERELNKTYNRFDSLISQFPDAAEAPCKNKINNKEFLQWASKRGLIYNPSIETVFSDTNEKNSI